MRSLVETLRASVRAFAVLASLSLAADPIAAWAAECGEIYTVQPDETLFDIAARTYGDGQRWTAIYYTNPHLLSGDPSVRDGESVYIPCLPKRLSDAGGQEAGGQGSGARNPGGPGSETAPVVTPRTSGGQAEMRILTGTDWAPFTDRSWESQGMVTEIVRAALSQMPYAVAWEISWEDDWEINRQSVDAREFDMGFPWLKPDCEAQPDEERCKRFHFSDPLASVLIMVFARRGDALADFSEDADLTGKTLCRPAGYYTFDLDRPDRRWLHRNLVTLERPKTPAECFHMLADGKVDAVVVNEYLGRFKIAELGLQERVAAAPNPLSEETLHLIISKAHWRGTTFPHRFNAGLRQLRASGELQAISEKHQQIFWAQVGDTRGLAQSE